MLYIGKAPNLILVEKRDEGKYSIRTWENLQIQMTHFPFNDLNFFLSSFLSLPGVIWLRPAHLDYASIQNNPTQNRLYACNALVGLG